MSDWPKDVIDLSAGGILSSSGEGSPVADLSFVSFSSAAQAWFQANTALYYPVLVRNQLTVTQLGWQNGATVGDHADVGIFDKAGTRLTSTGSTATAGINLPQMVDVADVTLSPALYYLAMVADGAVGVFARANLGNPGVGRGVGCAQQASAFPLPANAVFSAFASSNAYVVFASVEGAVF